MGALGDSKRRFMFLFLLNARFKLATQARPCRKASHKLITSLPLKKITLTWTTSACEVSIFLSALLRIKKKILNLLVMQLANVRRFRIPEVLKVYNAF